MINAAFVATLAALMAALLLWGFQNASRRALADDRRRAGDEAPRRRMARHEPDVLRILQRHR